jgi:hypothetical protein
MDSQGIGALGDIQAQMGGGQQLSGQSLGVSKIIMHYFQNRGIPLSAGMQGVQKEIAQGLKLIQHRDSVMGLKMLSPEVAQIHFFTTGTEATLDQDIKFFVSQLKEAGVHTVYDSEMDPISARAMQELGAQIQPSDNPKYKFKATL